MLVYIDLSFSIKYFAINAWSCLET
ncbi:protein of unknown function [Brevefilum fermentans]|uniref:Uncharacterized protein n=1 Tax=Candidatus Brevifilum fermentans TaxID=1986204 RepID=A0A1Y6K4C1_9CHLR|nr:protein of unknown function [Brevefilum fermentans]